MPRALPTKVKALACWLLTAGLMVSSVAHVKAEETDSDQAEYLSHCAECHGVDGKGAGPSASKLKTRPSDLTLIAKKNNGVFPITKVYSSIDGRYEVESHEIDDMPIWGCRHSLPYMGPGTASKPKAFKPDAPKVFKPDPYESHLDLSCDPPDTIASRIMSVVNYLRRIQER
jgi:hypothetical protein